MGTPISLSQNFENKNNVRSFDNILKLKTLKSESEFLQLVTGKGVVSEISPEIKNIISVLRTNLRNNSKGDFKNYFSSINKEENLKPVSKDEVFSCCWTALNEIIPKNFYGNNSNSKIFKKLVHTVIFSMKRQHFILSKVVQKWDFTVEPWKSIKEDEKIKDLHNILVWIVKFILSPMICLNFYVTSCKLDADENKLFFFWKNHWQQYYDKKISKMVFCKILKRHEPFCLGKNTKRKYTVGERLRLKQIQKEIPRLHLVLKPNKDCRPIVRYKSNQTKAEKYKIKERLNFLRLLTSKTQTSIESSFSKLYQKWTERKKPRLYFIKTDLSNAFGSIIKEKLMRLLSAKHLEFQKSEKNIYLKKKVAQQYKEMVVELRKPLLVRAGKTVYEWTEGLVQGYKYSPALSELYYTCLDEIYFTEHLKESSELKLFTRVVDDYLYITESLEDAHLFLNALSNYRNVNYEKTTVNFEHETIKSSEEITFLGYSYNTKTLEVSRAKNVFTGQMCFKMAFSGAIGNLNKFLENRIGQSGIQINSHLFNFTHNSEELVWRHVFTTFCLSANKFITIIAILSDNCDMKLYISLYKKRVAVKMTNAIITTLLKTKPQGFQFMYCINHFRYLAFKALYLCAKETPKCTGLIPLIKVEMAKCNCLFGKWKDHAALIETNGETRRNAVKEICKRQELRNIVKGFDLLPTGFKC